MEELSQILKNNRTDDLTWFCSLSESELVNILFNHSLSFCSQKLTLINHFFRICSSA